MPDSVEILEDIVSLEKKHEESLRLVFFFYLLFYLCIYYSYVELIPLLHY